MDQLLFFLLFFFLNLKGMYFFPFPQLIVFVTFIVYHILLYTCLVTHSIFYFSESVYAVQAYGIHADYSLGTHVFQEIEEALTGYEIGILGEVM